MEKTGTERKNKGMGFGKRPGMKRDVRDGLRECHGAGRARGAPAATAELAPLAQLEQLLR